MKLTWHDTLDIAIELSEKYPDEDVQYIRFTDLHRYVCELDGFDDDPNKSNEAILEAIQMAWLEDLDESSIRHKRQLGLSFLLPC